MTEDREWKRLKGLSSAILVIVVLGLVFALAGEREPRSDAEAERSALVAEFYICPMNCVPPLPEYGDCPVCGMELTPYQPDDHGGAPRLELTSMEAGAAQIEVARVERRFVSRVIRMYGQIEYDPGYFSRVDAFTNGIIDKVYVRREGEFIRPNQKLFDFYSAEIYEMELELLEIAQQIPEYIEGQLGEKLHPSFFGMPGRQGRPRQESTPGREHLERLNPEVLEEERGGAERKMDVQGGLDLQRRFATIRFRLRSFGLYDEDINQILRLERPVGIIPVRIPTLTSTVGGIVIDNNAYQGRYVNSGEPLMTIADPHFVWARLKAFESDYLWLWSGQDVEFSTEARPSEVFQGKITEIDPTFDEQTRTFNVGVIYHDPKNKLRPNMLVQAVVRPKITDEGRPARENTPLDKAPLVIPSSAPLITGRRAIVYVADPENPNVFEGREVVLGLKAGDYHIVKEGLAEGELVVTNGNFKIDSELQIQAAPSMMNPGEIPSSPPEHGPAHAVEAHTGMTKEEFSDTAPDSISSGMMREAGEMTRDPESPPRQEAAPPAPTPEPRDMSRSQEEAARSPESMDDSRTPLISPEEGLGLTDEELMRELMERTEENGPEPGPRER